MKRVALLIETSNQSGRDILMGVGQYAEERNNWEIAHHPGDIGSPWEDWLHEWEGDGVICRVHGPEMLPFLRNLDIPVVDVFGNYDTEQLFPVVHVEESAIGALGAQHLLERGFRSFGFVGISDEPFPDKRFDGFRSELESQGAAASRLDVERKALAGETKRIVDWLKGLEQPTGVMICSDIIAVEVYAACRAAGFSIPAEVALVSVDNDEVQTRLLRPPLSSIDANHSRIGYEAARLLGRMMKQRNWRKTSDAVVEIPPNSVKIRQSSDTFATPDPVTARAIGFIQQNACERINNDQVARAAGASRSVLQRKFRDQLGKTIHRVIAEERLNRARRLLEDSDLPFIEIAEICGYDSQQSLNRACAQEWNQTPRQIRES